MPGGDPRASSYAAVNGRVWVLAATVGTRGFREPRRCYVGLEPQSGIPLERQALKSHQETRLREGRPRISSLPDPFREPGGKKPLAQSANPRQPRPSSRP